MIISWSIESSITIYGLKLNKVAAMDGSTASLSNATSHMDTTESLLNHNVSFNSSMNVTTGIGLDSTPNVSFSLSESEIAKLKQNQRQPLKDVSNNQNCSMDKDTDLDGSSMMVDEDSEPIINIDDTQEEHQQPNEDQNVNESLQSVSVTVTTISPYQVYFASQIIELGRRCWPSTADVQHYTKGCYWSPDGTCLLLPVHLDGMHVMELPLDLYEAGSIDLDRPLSKMSSAVHIPEGGTVYDCVWYPLMNSQQPDTCFWLATRQHEPIHMWDAFDGRLRCTYSGYDEVDEVVAAISLAFSHDGQKIFAGYKRCIKIFDTSRPGRSYDEYAVKFAVSCIAQNTDHPHTLTCGNWRGYIQHYDLRCPPKQGPLFTLGGHSGGITQLRYAVDTAGSWQLFSGARMCSKLLQWDMRNYKQPLREFQRKVNTNQRIQFDLCPQQSWLASGDTGGALNLWNLSAGENIEALLLQLHDDCCNGISFHPSLPILATSSGQYHFVTDDKLEDLNNTTAMDTTVAQLEQQSTISYENAVLLLWCGDSIKSEI